MIRSIPFFRSTSARALAAAALLLAAPVIAVAQSPVPAPEPEPTEDAPLVSFVPRPDAVFVQKTANHPTLGNTLVAVVLGGAEVERLKHETGRYDLFVVGPAGHQTVFRDDGKEGDAAGGDFEFTGIADIEASEIAERGEADRSTGTRGENRVPVFEGRGVAGQTTVAPFDSVGFEAGDRVQLTRSLSISSQGTFSPNEEEEHHGEEHFRSMVAESHVPGTNQFQDRVLMIRNPAVVADPTRTFDPCTGAGTQMGVWTFGHLATAMANQAASGINPSTFVETWLNEWLVNPQIINGFNVPPRNAIAALISDWKLASGGPNAPLNLGIAPFRLLAINPRIDLRTTVGGGGGYGGTASGAFLDAGEARFTFGIVLPANFTQSQQQFILHDPLGNGCRATRFSVIFEYRVPKCECKDVRNWARQWRRLNSFVPGSATYNGLLEKLTRTFTDANRNPTRPNRNAIGQVRSNEISLQPPWEIREFQLRMMPWSFLLETTTADTPDDSFNNTNTFGSFVIDVLNGVAGPSIPLFYPLGSPQNFLGAHPQTPNPNTTFWNAPNILPVHFPTRHQISLGTCNGCHARETNTIFQHIVSSTPLPAPISGFLTGIHVIDPVDPTVTHVFDDLARRETDLNAVARMICARFRPVRFHPVFGPIIGPLASDGTEVQSIEAGIAAESDPGGPPLSVAPEDFLRETVQQVH